MIQAAIESILREKIGLEANSLGSNTIARAIRQRMIESGILDMPSYLLRLQTSAAELEALIENVIVPETWFFRDREPFVFLKQYVIKEWLPAHPSSVFRVLSIPCSTGEEPYSIAITLLEAGLTSRKIHIDAIDISKSALKKARRAIYEKHSFRGNYSDFQKIYFQKTEEGYQLSNSIKCLVNFIQGNLIADNFYANRMTYDAIFCRNLFIYLERPAREKAIQVIENLLNSNGLLFVGHSETGQFYNSSFIYIQHPLAFAYKKTSVETSIHTKKHIIDERLELKNAPAFPVNLPKLSGNSYRHQKSSLFRVKTENTQESLLETARKLANQGDLNKATNLCETYLTQNPISEEAYFLLGEIYQAAGNEESAEECFSKAIYLQPAHYEALTHLALLKEHRGDHAGASVIRQRIQRLYK